MAKRFYSCSPEYMLHLLSTETENAGFYKECDSIIRLESINYTYHICNCGVVTAEKTDSYKECGSRRNLKADSVAFSTMFHALMYHMNNHISVDPEFFNVKIRL